MLLRFCLLLSLCASPSLAVEIEVGSSLGSVNGNAVISPTLHTQGGEPAAVQIDLRVGNGARFLPWEGKPDCSVAPTIGKNDTTFQYLPAGCDPFSTCTHVRAIVFSLDNPAPIPDGSDLFSCKARISEPGEIGVFCSQAGAADVDGGALVTECVDGIIHADGDAPTRTATSTATRTAVPTPTLRALCVGDCNGDNEVPINELITGVGVALGAAAVGSCFSLDRNRDGSISIDELIAAVSSALSGCPGADTPTRRPSATPTKRPTATNTMRAPSTPTPSPTENPFGCAVNFGDDNSSAGSRVCAFEGSYNRTCGRDDLGSGFVSDGDMVVFIFVDPDFYIAARRVTDERVVLIGYFKRADASDLKSLSGQARISENGSVLLVEPDFAAFKIGRCDFNYYLGFYIGSGNAGARRVTAARATAGAVLAALRARVSQDAR